MSLTERERKILELAEQGFSDYRIAQKLNANASTITRSHKTAKKKLAKALEDIEWASKKGLPFSEFDLTIE